MSHAVFDKIMCCVLMFVCTFPIIGLSLIAYTFSFDTLSAAGTYGTWGVYLILQSLIGLAWLYIMASIMRAFDI